MNDKTAKLFQRIIIIIAVVWLLGFLGLDIAWPWLSYEFHDPNKPFIGGHGGGWTLLGSPLCIIAAVIAYIILRIKSRKDQ